MNDVANETVQELGIAIGNDDVLPDDWSSLWVACKIGIVRATRDLNISFGYHDEKRWDAPLPF